jgi:hypothetical protein
MKRERCRRSSRAPLRRARRLVLALALVAGAPRGARAASDVHLGGILDLAASTNGPALSGNRLIGELTPFDPCRLRLIAGGSLATGFEFQAQALASGTNTPRLYGAAIVWTPRPERDLHLSAGLVPWVVGTYAPRLYSDQHPLIGTPMIYQHRTGLTATRPARDVTDLLAGAGRASDPTYGGAGAAYVDGMAIVDAEVWDVGVTLTGSARPLEFALGISNGTPSAPEPRRDRNDGKCVLGRVGFAPLPELRAGVSGAVGPYLPTSVDSMIPVGHTLLDYAQHLVMADAEFLTGHLELRGEFAASRWSTPRVGDLIARGGYVEGRVALPHSVFAAARGDAMRFSDVTSPAGEREPWDYPTDRLETGLGYRVNRAITLKSVFQRTWTRDEDAVSTDDLWALQMVAVF